MMRRRVSTMVVPTCCLIALLGACSMHRARDPAIDGASRNVITEAELDSVHASSVYEAIAKLRGEFLTYRGETSLQEKRSKPFPSVFMDGVRYGELADLRNVPASQVSRIRLLRAWEATTQYGTGYPSGVIEITSKH